MAIAANKFVVSYSEIIYHTSHSFQNSLCLKNCIHVVTNRPPFANSYG